MSEQRLIDVVPLRNRMANCLSHLCESDPDGKSDVGSVSEMLADFIGELDNCPTIDPETLPIVRELRAKIGNMEDNERYMRKQLDNLRENLKKANKTAENWENCLCHEIETRKELEQKLARYEKAEKEGRLVIAPDKLYDLVYDELSPEESYITEHSTEGVAIKFAGDYIRPDELGETVFLTREEAEAALKERGDDGL